MSSRSDEQDRESSGKKNNSRTDSTEDVASHINTGEDRDFTVNVTSQGKNFIRLPHYHMSTAGIEEGDTVGIKPINYNEQFCIAITSDDSVGLSRQVRESRNNKPESLLTIPKRISTVAGIVEKPIRFNSGPSRIIGIVDHEPAIRGQIEVYNATEVLMSRWKSGVYAFQIPEEIYTRVTPSDSVWFWYDVFSDGFIFMIETDEDAAPPQAIELNVQETEKAKSDYLIHLPKQICDALQLSGKRMKWAHNGNDKIMGLYQQS